MKVLFLTREYPPFEIGGVARHTACLVKALRKLGVFCRILSFGDPAYSEDGVTFLEPRSSILSKSAASLPSDARVPQDIMRFTEASRDIMDKEDFDIVHVEEPYVGAFVRHAHKVTTIHDTSYGELKSIFRQPSGMSDMKRAIFFCTLGPYLEWVGAQSSDAIIVPSPQVQQELENIYRLSSSKISVIRNGVDLEHLPQNMDKSEAKRALGLSPMPLVFTSAQHVARKRLETLIDAVALMKTAGGNGFDVVVGGEGPLTPHLVKRCEERGVSDLIRFVGWLSREKLELHFAAADVFVLTSDYEAGPISLLEAMAAGAATVSSQIEGFPALMRNGVDGLLFPPGDARALSHNLNMLLGDAALRDRLSVAGHRFAQRFDWGAIARETMDLYGSLL